MLELSLHILDIVQNSIHAGANEIRLVIDDLAGQNQVRIAILDNGKGMDEATLHKLSDPFFTSKNKKTGLGIPLFRQHAEAAEGGVDITSEVGRGTTIEAWFVRNHIDRQPMGDLVGTLSMLVRSNPSIRFILKYATDVGLFEFDTHEIMRELDGVPIDTPEVTAFIKEYISSNLEAIDYNHDISIENKPLNT